LASLTIETHKRRLADLALVKQNENLEQLVQARTLALQESEKTFSYVMEHSPLLIFTINQDGNLGEFNPEAESQLGYNLSQAVGKNPIELFVAEESRKKAQEALSNVMNGNEARGVELFLMRGDGEKVEFEFSGSLGAADSKTGLRKMVVIGQEITQKKALQLSLIKAREAAESSDRIKSLFVASMSHELRTPLNSIIGFLGIVLQGMSGELNVKQKDQLGRAYNSSKHLLSLISDVIDISKIEAGFLQTHAEKFELKPLLLEVEHAVEHIAADKKLVLTMDCANKLMLNTDRRRLYQAVLNVVSNALKYTEEGTVNVSASLINRQVVITIQDTGIGIDKANMAIIFKPFERIDSRLKIKTLGTGLGLYLTRKILSELLGGTVEVTSKPEEGSIFTITIPIKMPKMVEQNNTTILDILESL
jgi:PAS domain S-box-containing protein